MKKRMISVLLVLCMLLSIFPATAFAEGIKDDSVKVENPFTDVSKSDWFYDSVMYALNSGLFAGVSADRFDPQGTMTRAMYITPWVVWQRLTQPLMRASRRSKMSIPHPGAGPM